MKPRTVVLFTMSFGVSIIFFELGLGFQLTKPIDVETLTLGKQKPTLECCLTLKRSTATLGRCADLLEKFVDNTAKGKTFK